MYFNHATAGALVVKPIIEKYGKILSEKEKNVLWFVGITSAVLPDFDIAYSVIRNLEDHRSFLTHGIVIYLVAFFLIFFLSYFQKKEVFGRKFFKILALVFLVGVSSHFLIDFFVGGLALFAPITYQVLGFDMNIKNGYNNRLLEYLISKYMILEISIFTLFLYIFKDKKYFVPRFFALSYFLIASISFVLVSTIFF